MVREILVPGTTKRRGAHPPMEVGVNKLLRKPEPKKHGPEALKQVFGADLAVPLGDVRNSLTSIKNTKVGTSSYDKADKPDTISGTDT
jgi:hypothetical protein